MVATGFGFAPAVEGGVSWACAGDPNTIKTDAETINVAESTDLMTNPKEIRNTGEKTVAIIDLGPIKHICLVGNNCAPVQGAG